MMRFEGTHSVFDIAQDVELDYWIVREYVGKFLKKNLVQALPIPGEAMKS
jgi:hypothetical protein